MMDSNKNLEVYTISEIDGEVICIISNGRIVFVSPKYTAKITIMDRKGQEKVLDEK